MTDPTDSLTEIETRPHVAVADCDREVSELLTEIRQQIAACRPIDQLAFAACGHLHFKNVILAGELKRHQNMIEAVNEGQRARSEGKPKAANPYVPDEPDFCWTFWNTGWAAG